MQMNLTCVVGENNVGGQAIPLFKKLKCGMLTSPNAF